MMSILQSLYKKVPKIVIFNPIDKFHHFITDTLIRL